MSSDFDQFLLEKYDPKALRTTTSEVVLLLGQKKLATHVVLVFWVVNLLSVLFPRLHGSEREMPAEEEHARSSGV